MRNQNYTFKEEFKIRASEVDKDHTATLPAICNLLQEIAGNHALELKFDITDLQKDHLTWVLHQLQVEMNRFPNWRENITIQTWPSGSDGLRAYRDFLILDGDENIIGRALSYWLILNMKSRRPTSIPKEILKYSPTDIDHVLPITDDEFSEIKQADTEQTFEVRKTDLDLNRHVNNVRYIEWALACLQEEIKANNIDIKFLGEAAMGDSVLASAKNTNANGTHFHLTKKGSQDTLAFATVK